MYSNFKNCGKINMSPAFLILKNNYKTYKFYANANIINNMKFNFSEI